MKIFYLTFVLSFIFTLQLGYTQQFMGEGVWEHPPGYYYMLDYPVRIRSQPNLEGEIIGILGINSRIRVISSEGWNSLQRVDNVWAPWYRIQYGNITGYVWGGFIAGETLVFDIDNNGIDDYFHWRISDTHHVFYYINALTDIFIYINNERIPTTDIKVTTSDGRIVNVWQHCEFQVSKNNTVLIILSSFGGGTFRDTFEVDRTGKITLIERYNELLW